MDHLIHESVVSIVAVWLRNLQSQQISIKCDLLNRDYDSYSFNRIRFHINTLQELRNRNVVPQRLFDSKKSISATVCSLISIS